MPHSRCARVADEHEQPKARLVVVREYCTHASGSDCERCLHACPHGAISLPDEGAPVVDHELCTGCGICFGICDAFAPTRLTINDLHARIRRIAIAGDRAYLTCRNNVSNGMEPATNVVVLPCLSMVPPELWTLMLAENIRLSVACNLRYCEECGRAGEIGGMLYPRAIELAQERTGNTVLFSLRPPEKRTLTDRLSNDDALGRRAIFTDFASDMSEIASGRRRLKNSTVLQDFYERRERQRASARLNLSDDSAFASFAPLGRKKRVMLPRQRMMLEAIDRMPEMAERVDVAVSETDIELCCGAGDCMRACPTGARWVDDETGKAALDVRLCIGCGICVNACHAGACSVVEATGSIYVQDDPEDTQPDEGAS